MSRWVGREISYGGKGWICGLNYILDGIMFEGNFVFFCLVVIYC